MCYLAPRSQTMDLETKKVIDAACIWIIRNASNGAQTKEQVKTLLGFPTRTSFGAKHSKVWKEIEQQVRIQGYGVIKNGTNYVFGGI